MSTVGRNGSSLKKKINLFLAGICHELYTQLRDFCLPKELSEQSFDDIKGILQEHFRFKSNLIVERFKFHSLRQSELQSPQEYLVLHKSKQLDMCLVIT